MRILITGVAGLMGSHLAKWLLTKTDHDVFGIDNLSCGDPSNIVGGYYKATIGREPIDHIFKIFRPDIVYHCAAYAAEGLSPFIRNYNYTNNLLATADIVTNCIAYDVQRLVFCSSMATYGNGQTPPFIESGPCNPIDPYGIAKYASERDIQVAGEQHGLDWCIIRPHNLMGQGQVCTQKYRNVLGIWMWRHLNNKPLFIYGDGQQQRAFSFIEDQLEPMYLAGTSLASSKEIINLGGPVPITIQEAAETLVEVMGSGRIIYKEPRHEVKEAWCTIDKSQKLLDYRYKTDFKTGLTRMWKWAKTHTHPIFKPVDIELRKGIYSYWRHDEPESNVESQELLDSSDSSLLERESDL
jgi:UDP-glucose 4-epimerase